MQTCLEKIKQARPDKDREPEEERADVKTETDQVLRPAVVKVKVEVKARVAVRARVEARVAAKVRAREEIVRKEVSDMPGFDRTGPQGAGPMTGGRRGYCNPAVGDVQPVYGGGFGYGARRGGRLGLGRQYRGAGGMGRRFFPGGVGYVQSVPPESTMESEDVLNRLKAGVDTMNEVLRELKEQIKKP